MRLAALVLLWSACATPGGDELVTDSDAIASAKAWYRIIAANALGPATVEVANGYKVVCPDGHSARACDVTALVVPASCGFECTDGLLGLQGDSLVRGSFAGSAFVIAAGFDTYSSGLGSYSIYKITGAPTCSHAPCPGGLVAAKLDLKTAGTKIASVDLSHAVDPNYVLDPTRGDDQIASSEGLLATGHIVSHVFRADRVFRLETSHPACDPQLVARIYAYNGETELRQFRTDTEAEHFVPPADVNGEFHSSGLVRSAETLTTVEFTSGSNDLWAQKFEISKVTCAITVTGEH
ncbi:hypothetical protein BH11MYX1_BH11MYX1_37020 [soil metagenome]